MKASHHRTVRVFLELDHEETQWLKVWVQNPRSPAESAEEAEMRKRFWEALNPPQPKETP